MVVICRVVVWMLLLKESNDDSTRFRFANTNIDNELDKVEVPLWDVGKKGTTATIQSTPLVSVYSNTDCDDTSCCAKLESKLESVLNELSVELNVVVVLSFQTRTLFDGNATSTPKPPSVYWTLFTYIFNVLSVKQRVLYLNRTYGYQVAYQQHSSGDNSQLLR